MNLIRHLRPRGVIIENVGGIETYKGGSVVRRIQSRLSSFGYSCRSYLLESSRFAVPQKRRRIFMAAVLNGSLPSSIRTRAGTVTVKEAIDDLPRIGNGSSVSTLAYRQRSQPLSTFQLRMRVRSSRHVANCMTSLNTKLITRRFAAVPPGGNWQNIPAALFRNYNNSANCHRWLYRRLRADRPAVTISNFRKNMLIHPWENRTLSVREAARLQGIPDHFVFLGNLQSQQQQVANAVPPRMGLPVIRTVLRAIRAGKCA